MSEIKYPKVRLVRTESGYRTADSRFWVERDECTGSRNGSWVRCWNVYRDRIGGEVVSRFAETLAEARLDISSAYESESTARLACERNESVACPDAHTCRHGING